MIRKERSSSMRKSRRQCSGTERGFALVSAIVFAFLFFAMIGLILIESTISLRMAHQYRAKVVANNLAESAVQLALEELVIEEDGVVAFNSSDGSMTTTCKRKANPLQGGFDFVIEATGQSAGVTKSRSRVVARGHQSVANVVVREMQHVE